MSLSTENRPTDRRPTDADPTVRPRARGWYQRYPFVSQRDETDCAAACLAMVTEYYGNPVSVAKLRDLTSVDARGASLWSVGHAVEALGFHARPLSLDAAALGDLETPTIVHWQGFHFVVVYAGSPESGGLG